MYHAYYKCIVFTKCRMMATYVEDEEKELRRRRKWKNRFLMRNWNSRTIRRKRQWKADTKVNILTKVYFKLAVVSNDEYRRKIISYDLYYLVDDVYTEGGYSEVR